MSCTVRQRERIKEAAAELRALDSVIGVDVFEPSESPRGRWELAATLTEPATPAVQRCTARHGLALPDCCARGSGYRLLATA